MAERLARHLEGTSDLSLADVAHTLQVGRRAFPCRAVVVARDRGGAVEALRQVMPGAAHSPTPASGVVFLFPGQGSQYDGMSRELYRELPAFRASIDECARLLAASPGPGPPRSAHRAGAPTRTSLNRTDLTQPALFALEYALAQLWISWGVRPTAMAGHSVGEYVAACIAGVFSLEDGLRLIAARGRLMQATARGGMLAVAAAPAAVEPWLGETLDLAAINGPSQCVVTGPREQIEALHEALEGRRIVSRILPGERAFHSRLMEPILAAFEGELHRVKLSPPAIRIASNLTGGWMTDDEATSPRYWVEHLRGDGALRRQPALPRRRRWPAVRRGRSGPHVDQARSRVPDVAGGLRDGHLAPAALARRSAGGAKVEAGRSELDGLLEALGGVWASGVDLDFGVLNPSSGAASRSAADLPLRAAGILDLAAGAARTTPALTGDSPRTSRRANRSRSRPVTSARRFPWPTRHPLTRSSASWPTSGRTDWRRRPRRPRRLLRAGRRFAHRRPRWSRASASGSGSSWTCARCSTARRSRGSPRASGRSSGPARTTADMSQFLELVEHMSDEEVEAILAKWEHGPSRGTSLRVEQWEPAIANRQSVSDE